MKKTLLSSLLLLSAFGWAQNGPITFEPGAQGASWVWKVFENGANAPLEFVSNPSISDVNPSATVAKMTTLATGAPFAGVENQHPGSQPSGPSSFGPYVITAENCTVRIKVYKSVISDVGIKFATATNASTGEIKIANTLINQWEELVFDFSSRIGQNNDQIIIFPDFQARSSDNVCYFDEISFGPEIIKPVLPLDFEVAGLDYIFSNFGNTDASVLSNPFPVGLNTSSKAAILIKNNGPEWSGSFIELGSAINFSTTQTMKMKVLAPQAGIIVKLKLENLSNPAFNIEVDATTTVANAWEELSFTFNGINTANNYKRVVVFFNFGVVGTGEYYLFDDIQLDNAFSTPGFNLGMVSVLPNPVNDNVTVRMTQPFEKVTVSSILGQIVVEQAAQGTESQLSIGHLSKGIYVLAVQTTDGKINTSKLIKE
ncbi:MAG: T9SS type A sorting domain-containing protein [Flavobacterium sp.]|nr:T9SS type A sorting domain-containing protein [Flavobacterium sp.]